MSRINITRENLTFEPTFFGYTSTGRLLIIACNEIDALEVSHTYGRIYDVYYGLGSDLRYEIIVSPVSDQYKNDRDACTSLQHFDLRTALRSMPNAVVATRTILITTTSKFEALRLEYQYRGFSSCEALKKGNCWHVVLTERMSP